jgi:hypothetical protein
MRQLDNTKLTKNQMMKEQEAIKSAKVMIEIFNEVGVKYWLDYGALLGAVRDGKFISWDTDIEPYMFYENDEQKYSVYYNFKDKGFSVAILPLNKGFIAKKKGYGPLSIGWFKITKIEKMLSLACYYIPTFIRTSIIYGMQKFYSNTENEKLRPKTTEGRDENQMARFIRGLFPMFFCGKFKNIKMYDFKVSVPAKAEELLLMRYGEDWKIPKKIFESYTT